MFRIILFVLLVFSSAAYAQFPKNTLSLSFFGEMGKHPGFSANYLYNLSSSKKDMSKIHHLWNAGLDLSFYSHKSSHIGISLTPKAAYQYLTKGGFAIRADLGAGFLRQFNNAPTYTVNDNHEVKKIPMAGRNKLLTTFSIGVGQNFYKQNRIPFGWHFDIGVFTESPTNTGFIPHLFVRTGVDYYFNRSQKK